MSLLLLLKGEEAEAEPEVSELSTRVRVRESPPLRLHYEAETPKGRFYRWGKDEPRPENVPSGGGFSSTMPGGFDTQRVTLPRKPGVAYSDMERLTTIRALGAGGEVASEVRLERSPRTSGEQFSIGPEAKGWIAHLGDDTSAAEIYRDVDLNSWTGPGRARQNALEAESYAPSGGIEVLTDPTTGVPALRLYIDGHWELLVPISEAWYDAGPGARVAKVYYDFAGDANTGFLLIWGSGTTDAAAAEYSADLFTATTGSGTAEPAAARRFFQWQWYFKETPAGNDGVQFACDLRRLAVYGNHGLTLQGTEPTAGFLASDVIANAVSRWAPLLRYTTGSTGTIRPSSFVIPHLAFKDQTTAQVIVEEANRYELRPYAVWEDRTLHYHDWGDRGRRWRTRVAPSQLSETGPTVERLRNGVIVRWQDVDGSPRTAGPIGSGADAEDESLEDNDPENPANQRGLKMYGAPVDMGGVSVQSQAVRVGALYLERLKETDTSGQMQLVGTVEDDRGVERPAWQVRAGDTIVPVDAADTRERRIIRTDYNEDTLTNTIDLDAPPDGTADLLAQLGLSIADIPF